MNKTVFPLVMAVLTACPVLFSCTEKEQEVPVENKIYEYRFELAGDDTRAYLNDDGVFWEAGDKVGLFAGTTGASQQADVNVGSKTIVLQSASQLANGSMVYAYYPYVEENTSVSASKVLFPAEQSGGSISAMPLAGIPAEVVTEGEYNGVIRFLNLGSVIDFRVFSSTHNNEKVESISLKADAGNLAGTATIDLTGVDWDDETNTATIPNLTWAEGAGSSTVTLTQTASVAADKDAAIADGNLYMVVAPGTYSGTITVTTNAARYTFPFTNQTFKQNGLKRFNMNLDSDSAVREAFSKTYEYVGGSLTAGTYLIVSDDDNSPSPTVALFPNVVTENWGNGSSAVSNGQKITEKPVTLNGTNPITTEDGEIVAAEIELVASGSGWMIQAKDGKYLVAPTERYHISFTTNPDEAAVFTAGTPSNNKRSLTVNDSKYYFYHSNSASGFTMRNTGSVVSNLRFYKLGGSTLSQTLEFSETEFTYDLASGESFVEPTLTGAKTTVEFSSEPEAIATVDDETGEVTFNTNHKTGVVTIKATAIGMDGYASAEATYTITVTDSDKPVVTYNKVTSADDLEVGAKYLIVFEGLSGDTDGDGDPKVFNPVLNDAGTQFAKATSSAVDVTLSSGVIESSDVSDYEFTLESGYYLKADRAAKYIYPGTSGSSSVLLAESPASHALAISFNNGIAQISNGSGNNVRYIVWSTNNHYFSSNQQVSGSYSTGICLYKLDDGRQAQDISFSASAAEYDLYKSTWTVAVPDLIGAQGTVTYSSSDEAVAQVNSTGAVTIPSTAKKGDTAIITASAAGNETYKAGEASYTITIVDTTPVIPGEGSVYRKVMAQSELVEGGKYLVVYDNESSSKVFKPIVNGSTFTTSAANAVDVTISSNTITSSDFDDCQIVFQNAEGNTKFAMWVPSVERYLIVRNDSASFVADASEDGYRATFTVGNNGTVTIVRSSNRRNYSLRYSSSDNYFQVSTSSSSNMALYKLDEGGTTPDPGSDPDPDPTTPTYTQVSFATGITTGQYLVVNPADAQVFTTVTGNPNAAAVTPASGVISGDYASYELTITKSGSNITIQNGKGEYLYYVYTSGNTRVAYANSANGTWTPNAVSGDTNGFDLNWVSGTSSQHIYWSDTFFKIGSQTTGVHLYKKN